MATPNEPLEPGQILGGKYVVDAPFNKGGFAFIYVGLRLEDNLPVAIKALKVDVTKSDPAAIDRFIREAAIASHLHHPNLVRIHDFGKTRGDVLYMVMEKLHGRPLNDVLFYEPLPPRRVHHILRQMLDALSFAHGQGLMHRDIKPSNVFLCEVGASSPESPNEWVKILDFGVAKGVKRAGTIMRATLTLDGAKVGTPGYMAPETLTPGGKVSQQMDLYSIGILGYEMMTGEMAYPGKGMERAVAQMETNPAAPSGFVAEHPLYQIIAKLLERAPADRYATADHALRDLQTLDTSIGKLWM